MSEVFKKDRYTILDGAMGTMLQKSGLELGRQPDVLSIEQPEIVERIGRMYVESGSDWICANTFGCLLYTSSALPRRSMLKTVRL